MADTFTEALLLTALRRSERPADRKHPFGYGKERYFWSLLAAVSIFASGAVFALYEGFRRSSAAARSRAARLSATSCWRSAFVLESRVVAQAVRQIRAEAAGGRHGRS